MSAELCHPSEAKRPVVSLALRMISMVLRCAQDDALLQLDYASLNNVTPFSTAPKYD